MESGARGSVRRTPHTRVICVDVYRHDRQERSAHPAHRRSSCRRKLEHENARGKRQKARGKSCRMEYPCLGKSIQWDSFFDSFDSFSFFLLIKAINSADGAEV